MPIPFPGMNPYLEHPDLWPEVHKKLNVALADTLAHRLPARYRVQLRDRHYQVSGEDSLVVGTPGLNWERPSPSPLQAAASGHPSWPSQDSISNNWPSVNHWPTDKWPSDSPVSEHPAQANSPISVLVPVPQKVYETYIEIVNSAGEVVTIIEALSPKKKRPGRGRTLYERQREAIFGSPSHFVEIDLLRGWEPTSIYGPDESGDYRVLISRSEQRPRAQLYTWNVMETIPEIFLPLSGHDELLLSLKSVVDQACDRTDLLANYQQDPLPPLRY
ncbi:MAG: DUF4058 family protein, partial [Phormidesmis sp.]